ncbi:hypothetical protein FA95DRAFT_1553944 [Auriscalpium vulgare]|uniref:Uncharacterized protein n=1 Tax=Auriscalpium vulgare TaxID=40419 RepID=A0ACB8S665_9AGAM|nr:hypothetical protein FA95DRAFT_1553944 [Auriscalpium vulgare]
MSSPGPYRSRDGQSTPRRPADRSLQGLRASARVGNQPDSTGSMGRTAYTLDDRGTRTSRSTLQPAHAYANLPISTMVLPGPRLPANSNSESVGSYSPWAEFACRTLSFADAASWTLPESIPPPEPSLYADQRTVVTPALLPSQEGRNASTSARLANTAATPWVLRRLQLAPHIQDTDPPLHWPAPHTSPALLTHITQAVPRPLTSCTSHARPARAPSNPLYASIAAICHPHEKRLCRFVYASTLISPDRVDFVFVEDMQMKGQYRVSLVGRPGDTVFVTVYPGSMTVRELRGLSSTSGHVGVVLHPQKRNAEWTWNACPALLLNLNDIV